MGLQFVFYRSIAHFTNTASDELRILQEARTNNLRLGLTGLLHKEDGRYFQYLEGEANALFNVFDRIQHDRRHTALEVLSSGSCSERLFPDWEMGFCHGNHGCMKERVGNSFALARGKVAETKILAFMISHSGIKYEEAA